MGELSKNYYKLTFIFKLSKKTMSNITIYTDGSSRGNPGPGGYGVVMLSGPYRKELSQGFKLTTNNRMELLGVIVGLEAIKIQNSIVTIYTDSKYVVDSVEKGWVFGWEKKNFVGKKNPDLWMRFLRIYSKHTIKFIWVKGHANNKENNLCDKLAVEAALQRNLVVDEGYQPE
jgi:ribonuclease HI